MSYQLPGASLKERQELHLTMYQAAQKRITELTQPNVPPNLNLLHQWMQSEQYHLDEYTNSLTPLQLLQHIPGIQYNHQTNTFFINAAQASNG